MAASSNLGSLGPNYGGNDSRNANNVEVEEHIEFPPGFGASDCSANRCVEFRSESDAKDSNRERKKAERGNLDLNINAAAMTFPSEHEATNPTMNFSTENFGLPPGFERAFSVANCSAEPSGDASRDPGHRMRETHNQNDMKFEHEGKGMPETIGNIESNVGADDSSTRVLRPKTDRTYDYDNVAADDSENGESNRTQRKERGRPRSAGNEFLSIRTKLRYLLHRIKYEQNLIDAYSAEGWKGNSVEKIKPEKELQRAKSGIFTYKLKIRDLFQRIDTLLAQGRLPESLFDSQGLIDCEDIFCAKCGSKDLSADNDIILCDGACERGFHQFCLEPPLLKEHIPPGDDPWLCPGCLCKLDCFNLLNAIQGTNHTLVDRWEKVFSEEAASTTQGKKLDDISGLPSDDSEDDDYNPKVEAGENVSKDESTSEGSDYFSASDNLATPANDGKRTGLPSEDSEDDDYNPEAPDNDAEVMQESSGSDFTSDSEDNMSPSQAKRRKTKVDETYQGMASDSSDEEYDGTAPKRKKRRGKTAQKSSDQTPKGTMNTNSNQGKTEHIPKRRGRKRLKVEGSVTSEQGSSSKRNTKSKFGEDVMKRLFESFKENQYPQRDVKERLAAELGLTSNQVSKWFENARRGFHQSSTSQAGN